MGIEVFGGKGKKAGHRIGYPFEIDERERGFESAWKSVLTHVPVINQAIKFGEFYPQNLIWRIDDMILHLNQMKKYLFSIKPRK